MTATAASTRCALTEHGCQDDDCYSKHEGDGADRDGSTPPFRIDIVDRLADRDEQRQFADLSECEETIHITDG